MPQTRSAANAANNNTNTSTNNEANGSNGSNTTNGIPQTHSTQPLPSPTVMTMEQMMATQTQFMHTMVQMLANLQQNQNQNQNPPPQQNHHVYGHPHPAPPRDKRGEFLKGRPPFFSETTEPLQANDWIKNVERQLEIAQCNDHEKVLYGAGQLQGAALDWWEAYRFAQEGQPPVTWEQFKEAFREHYVPEGLIKMKKKEFLALT